MSSAVGSLEAEALKRKARLAAIRQAAEGDGNGTGSADAEPTVVKLRNYEPTSDIPAVKTETPGLQKLELAEKEKEILKNDPDAAIGMKNRCRGGKLRSCACGFKGDVCIMPKAGI
jgi:hypothetical protein